ncbi:TRAP transporter large permease subunit [Phyllobacterium sp. 21LDTY02-6]|jgi:tripartite ATP-independent transporter DctM subunit|uniref:TRAP transporter large permease n=1 Tax=unclassified Phyllobacterium TaxID=2638441 RepID=UPI002020C5E9|nr:MULTISPECIES: TRAP transporter large permease subunit [unclassified Phyllobacterium]MCO4317603.1 TRAP transporter large permease subunit [Phyllobacterium sp. 21LDTY02-6]MCX8293024.1 TRAP transporter large permease subunit [Phyllobacterium sp. 0TCS1.6A]
MMQFFSDNLAPLMFFGLVIFMVIGYPAAFSLAAVGLFFGFVAIEMGAIGPDFLGNLTYQMFSVLSNELLLAIPFFTFMGVILEKCGLAEDLLDGFGQLFGGVRGGLSYAVILVGAILGAITGTVAASVIAMGLISLPVMAKYGYNIRHATGVIAASGTITQLIPPSLVLIVLADQLGRSPGDMYIGATGASIVQVLLFAGWVFVLSIIRPHHLPALPPEARTLRGWPLFLRCARGMIPSLALIFVVLGTIFLGLATPTEAGAMGVVGAMFMAWINRRLTWDLVYQAMTMTMRLTAMVVFILLGARVFSLVFQGVGGGHWIETMLTSLPGGIVGFLIFVNIFIFVLAFFLDFFEIAFIIIPLLAPAASALGIDLVWFGVMICANMQTSFMHPPFGFALFYLRGIAPKSIKTSDIYMGAIPFLCLQLLLVGLLIAFPEMVTYFLDVAEPVDLKNFQIELPNAPGNDLGSPPSFDLGQPPKFN